MRTWIIALVLGALCAGNPLSLCADEPVVDPRDLKVRELEARLEAAERQIRAQSGLEFAVHSDEQVDDSDVIVPVENIFTVDDVTERNDKEPTIEERLNALEKKFKASSEPKPEKKKKDEYPTFKITGFTQLDTAFYSQTPLNIATVGNAQDGTGFRRARLAVFGKAAENTGYQLEVDFATAGRPSFFDTYVEQTQLPFFGAVRAGQYLQPFSVDAMSGFRNLPFLERSLPFLAFVPFRRVGIMAYSSTEDQMTNWAYSVFRTGGFNNAPLGDDRFATDFGNVGGYSFSGRITQLIQYEEGDCHLWHIGGAYDFSQLGANNAIGSGTPGNAGSPQPFYQARATPEFGPLGYPENSSTFGSAVNATPNFIDSGRYQANNFNLFGVETVYQDGPLSLQSEYMATRVDSVAGDVFYHGAYAEVMYRLTGEHRPYDKKLGSLKNVVPFQEFISFRGENKGIIGWGAWEVAARLSYVELRNPSSLNGHYYNSVTNKFDTTAKAGNGTLTDTTLGVTWFMTGHSKFQFNWIHAFLNNSAKGFSSADLFVTRVQVDF
jgi:phosphate-selective porin OprO/OprP